MQLEAWTDIRPEETPSEPHTAGARFHVNDPGDWDRVQSLFNQALDLPPEERLAFARAAASDEGIRGEVESLLAAHEKASGFLSDSPVRFSDDIRSASPVGRLQRGMRLGAFEIIGLLGTGGMGEVLRARDTRLERDVAIKVLSADLAADARSRDRFEREARAVSRLTHPGICTLYDVGSAPIEGVDVQFLVMEMLEGETLADRLRRGPLPLEQAMQTALEILDALSAAHAVGIIHRDLKPANIMLTKAGAKLLDFGLARLHVSTRASDSPAEASADPLTMPGMMFGTIPYMSPEQIRGNDADARSDLFAFGAVLYEMLTGRRAFTGESDAARIAAILEDDPPPLTAAAALVPASLERVVRACLAKEPAERWQHARDVALALRALAEGRPHPSSPVAARSRTPDRAQAFQPLWRVHATWAAVAAILSLTIWFLGASPKPPAPPVNPQPVVVLMDSPLEGRVYDPRTLAAGGTNADDISDALRGLPIVTVKENTSPMWHREEEVLAQNPDLIISHLSCLFDQRVTSEAAVRQHLFDMAQTRLVGFFGHVGAVNTRTKFLVYSRGRFGAPAGTWSNDVLVRFPHLRGRLFTLTAQGGETASFRDPATMQQLRAQVVEALGLP